MNRARPARALALAAALALCAAQPARPRAAQSGPAPARPGEFRLVRPAAADAPSDRGVFEFEAGGFSYRVAANGNGRRTKGNRTRRFNLRLGGGYWVEELRFGLHDGDLLLVCQLNDGGSGGGLVTRLEQPSMRALWKQEIPSFNLGDPLRERHALYVTGVGFVGKLDLRTGEYLWRQEGLHETHAAGESQSFNAFERPELAGDAVLFRDKPVYNRRKTLVVDQKTGKTIRVE